MLLLPAVTLLLLLSHARAQECDEIRASELGSTGTASADGAIASSFSGGGGNIPDVLLLSFRTVCLSAGTSRDKYFFASVIATYGCGGTYSVAVACPSGPYPRTDQFEFQCMDSGSGPVWQDSTLFVDDRNVPVNPSITTLRSDCSFCVSPADADALGLPNPVDPESHCAGMFLILCVNLFEFSLSCAYIIRNFTYAISSGNKY